MDILESNAIKPCGVVLVAPFERAWNEVTKIVAERYAGKEMKIFKAADPDGPMQQAQWAAHRRFQSQLSSAPPYSTVVVTDRPLPCLEGYLPDVVVTVPYPDQTPAERATMRAWLEQNHRLIWVARAGDYHVVRNQETKADGSADHRLAGSGNG